MTCVERNCGVVVVGLIHGQDAVLHCLAGTELEVLHAEEHPQMRAKNC